MLRQGLSCQTSCFVFHRDASARINGNLLASWGVCDGAWMIIEGWIRGENGFTIPFFFVLVVWHNHLSKETELKIGNNERNDNIYDNISDSEKDNENDDLLDGWWWSFTSHKCNIDERQSQIRSTKDHNTNTNLYAPFFPMVTKLFFTTKKIF